VQQRVPEQLLKCFKWNGRFPLFSYKTFELHNRIDISAEDLLHVQHHVLDRAGYAVLAKCRIT